MAVSRVTDASRVTEHHGASTALPPLGAPDAASFPAALGNATNDSETAENTDAAGGKPSTVRRHAGAAAGVPVPVTGLDDAAVQRSAPPLDSPTRPSVVLQTDTEIAGPAAPAVHNPQPAAPRLAAPAVNRDGASGPTAAPTAIGARRSPDPNAKISAASVAGSRKQSGPSSVDDPFACSAPSGPDGLQSASAPSNQTDAAVPGRTAASGRKTDTRHFPQIDKTVATIAPDPAFGMLGAVSAGAVPGGDTGLPAPASPDDDRAAAVGPGPSRGRSLAALSTGTRSNSTGDAPAGFAPNTNAAGQDASAQNATDSGAPTELTAKSFTAFDAHLISSGSSNVDGTGFNDNLPAAGEIASGAGLAVAILHVAARGGNDNVKKNPLGIGAAAEAPAVNPAPAGPSTESSLKSVAANLSPTDLPDQLFGHVIGSIQNPDHEVVLRLNPPELGDLMVRVQVSGRDVSAWFATPQVPVQQAISQAIGQLQNDLGNAGYNLAAAWVGADASSSRERNEHLPLPQQARAAVRGAEPVISPIAPLGSVNSGVSIYV